MNRSPARLVWLAVLAGVCLTGFVALRNAIGLELDPESMEATIAPFGIWAPLAFVGIVAFRIPFGLPSQIVLIGGGLVFGAASGTLYGAAGLVLSAMFMYLSARWSGRDAIERRMPERLQPLFDLASTRAGGVFLALGTGYPFGPITLYHLLAGVTGMAIVTFLVAVSLGALMRSALYTFFGSRLIAGDLGGIGVAAAAIVAALVIPMLFPTSREWLLRALGFRRDAPDDGTP